MREVIVMESELTPALARALEAAQRLARHTGAAQVAPLHLLWGLLEEEEGRAHSLLSGSGLRLQDFARPVTMDPPGSGPAVPTPESPELQAVLDQARHLQSALTADRTLATESVLLALVTGQPEIRNRLEALGLRTNELEAAVLSTGPPLQLDEPLRLTESAEETDSARILDANANRCREALRVIEDYCRFVLADAAVSGRLKTLRHRLTVALGSLPDALLLQSRDTLGDVGTALATEQEYQRHAPADVAQANFKRLAEGLRSLEEFGKLHGPDLARTFESMRYEVYVLEHAVLGSIAARRRLADVRLYVLISGAACAAALDWTIAEAAGGGAQIFQLREKNLSDRDLLERAREVRRWTRQAGALFLVNDRPDIARVVDADGVHLGQEDLSVHDARRILGPEALIGVSTHTVEQVRQAVVDGASYIGVGPTFPTTTKSFAAFAGPEFLRQAMQETSLPAFAIGGIHRGNIDQVISTGCRRIAVGAAICAAQEPRVIAAVLRRALDDAVGADAGG